MDAFRFELSAGEKAYLKETVTLSIAAALRGDADWLPTEPPTPRLREPFGVFVTLKIQGQLRGCIGYVASDQPVYQNIARMAKAAAFEDPRFPPLNKAEYGLLEVEISILSPVTPCPDPALITVGRHGLIVRQGMRQGLLLPQVPLEWGWDRETFLAHTCQKAQLPPDAWKRKDTEILWFEAEVF